MCQVRLQASNICLCVHMQCERHKIGYGHNCRLPEDKLIRGSCRRYTWCCIIGRSRHAQACAWLPIVPQHAVREGGLLRLFSPRTLANCRMVPATCCGLMVCCMAVMVLVAVLTLLATVEVAAAVCNSSSVSGIRPWVYTSHMGWTLLRGDTWQACMHMRDGMSTGWPGACTQAVPAACSGHTTRNTAGWGCCLDDHTPR